MWGVRLRSSNVPTGHQRTTASGAHWKVEHVRFPMMALFVPCGRSHCRGPKLSHSAAARRDFARCPPAAFVPSRFVFYDRPWSWRFEEPSPRKHQGHRPQQSPPSEVEAVGGPTCVLPLARIRSSTCAMRTAPIASFLHCFRFHNDTSRRLIIAEPAIYRHEPLDQEKRRLRPGPILTCRVPLRFSQTIAADVVGVCLMRILWCPGLGGPRYTRRFEIFPKSWRRGRG
jgi:hypothetical protein